MLTVEEFKECCMYAEGFSYHESPTGNPKFNQLITGADYFYLNSARFDDIIYPLFLNRVRQGINKNCMLFSIYIEEEFIRLKDAYYETIEEYYDTDKGLEQAIKYILEKL